MEPGHAGHLSGGICRFHCQPGTVPVASATPGRRGWQAADGGVTLHITQMHTLRRACGTADSAKQPTPHLTIILLLKYGRGGGQRPGPHVRCVRAGPGPELACAASESALRARRHIGRGLLARVCYYVRVGRRRCYSTDFSTQWQCNPDQGTTQIPWICVVRYVLHTINAHRPGPKAVPKPQS